VGHGARVISRAEPGQHQDEEADECDHQHDRYLPV
jgi:hypothetical protein